MAWYPYDGGKSVGESGSEGGRILSDEEHDERARITLEQDGDVAPFAITCGVYGWMVHTRYFGTETEARRELDAMKDALGRLVAGIPLESDPESSRSSQLSTRRCRSS